ncbi:hypothetical protein RRG08_058847 [Elysia crispata]|uniref:Uncharacterized protein n=1 Tax=Elysia crispata TaxID=231223 RepID=A0AAE1CPW8_9GAST|nr:hypothetical protein RRG08_058847 [Elysia crispata]
MQKIVEKCVFCLVSTQAEGKSARPVALPADSQEVRSGEKRGMSVSGKTQQSEPPDEKRGMSVSGKTQQSEPPDEKRGMSVSGKTQQSEPPDEKRGMSVSGKTQ